MVAGILRRSSARTSVVGGARDEQADRGRVARERGGPVRPLSRRARCGGAEAAGGVVAGAARPGGGGGQRAVGIGQRTLERWLAWYREAGLAAVLARVPGHGATGAACRLSAAQRRALVARSGRGQCRTYDDARAWVRATWGVAYRYQGMYALLARLGVHPKVPRPVAAKADAAAQARWKRGG